MEEFARLTVNLIYLLLAYFDLTGVYIATAPKIIRLSKKIGTSLTQPNQTEA